MMKLLIVEDNTEMRRLIVGFVRDVADSISECADGADALAAYQQHLPDWVLMDIKMPLVDGITATRQIIAAHPAAHIIIITDYDDAKLRAAAGRAGAIEYVLKDDLSVVRRILSRDVKQPAARVG
jgi:CheY-like chemotaxis protein